MPAEEQVRYSAMTGQSLYYMGQTHLRHKVLAVVEEDGVEQAAYALKLLQSDGELPLPAPARTRTQRPPADAGTIDVEGPVMLSSPPRRSISTRNC